MSDLTMVLFAHAVRNGILLPKIVLYNCEKDFTLPADNFSRLSGQAS